MTDDLAAYEWRTGGHGNCGILAMTGYDRDLDTVIGLMNTARLAAAVVDEHNATLDRGRVCLTPGCVYTFSVGPSGVVVAVTFPAGVELPEAEAVALESRLHDATEAVLSRLPFFAAAATDCQPLAVDEDVEPTLGSQKGPAPG